MQYLDIVHCAVLVNTNHGFVNLILNEYACSGQGQNNFVNGKYIQVGQKQRIITIDGYLIPLMSKEGLMVLEFIGQLTNDYLATYPLKKIYRMDS